MNLGAVTGPVLVSLILLFVLPIVFLFTTKYIAAKTEALERSRAKRAAASSERVDEVDPELHRAA